MTNLDNNIKTSQHTFQRFTKPFTALVQGASRGIGLAFVAQLGANVAVDRVYASARSATWSDGLQALAGSSDNRIRPLDLDVTDEVSVAAAARRLSDEGASPDLLINCAGVLHEPGGLQPERRLADVDPDALLYSFRVNALGPLLMAKHFAGLMPRNRHCVLANLSARVGSIGDNRLGGWYAYRASKAAQNQITRTLSIELRRRLRRIVCVALHPGTVATDLSAPFTRNRPLEQLYSTESAADRLLEVISGLDSDGNGHFFAYDGRTVPW